MYAAANFSYTFQLRIFFWVPSLSLLCLWPDGQKRWKQFDKKIKFSGQQDKAQQMAGLFSREQCIQL